MKKKVISIVLSLVFLLGVSTPIFAGSIHLLKLDTTNGLTALNGNINELFAETNINKLKSQTKTQLSESNIYFQNGQLYFQGKLETEDAVETFITSGEVYLAQNATMKEKVLLADFETYGNISFTRFCIYLNEDETSTISITMEFIDGGQLFHFEIKESSDVFYVIKKFANTKLSGEELDAKIIQLYSLGRNIINYEDDESMELVEFEIEVDENVVEPSYDYRSWDEFFDDLERYGEVELSDYNVPYSMFVGNGWNYQTKPGNCRVDAYRYENGIDMYLIHIGFLSLTNNIYNSKANSQVEVVNGMILEYDEYTDIVSVKYYGYPISYKNLKIGIYDLSGDNIFVTRTVNYNLGYGGSLIRALIAYVPYLNDAVDTFDELMPDYKHNNTYIFPATASEQYARYGEYIKAIGADSGNGYMDRPGNLFAVDGEIVGSVQKRATFHFSFTRSHSI